MGVVECDCERNEDALLGYGPDDRWYVLGEETADAALILAVMLGFNETFEA